MNTDQILKKLKEIQVEAFNNVHSDDEESELQVESATEEHNCDPVGGEEVKITRPKAEKVTEIKTLSRTTPMDGSKGVPEKIYVTDGTVKAITIESLQAQLDDLKKNMDGDRWAGKLGKLVARAESIWTESQQKPMPEKYKNKENELILLGIELGRTPINAKDLEIVLGYFP